MYRRLALLAVGLVFVGGSSLVAQDAILGQMYGAGVHAYFAGDFSQAHKDLTTAVSGGSEDPRCHYFRGLCYLELGREEEAKMDFEAGAELETQDVNKFFNVPGSLERIQGKNRVLLETYRAEGRMIALERERKLRAERYEIFQADQDRVLQERIDAAPPLPDDAEAPPPAIDPFGVETQPAEPTEPAEPAEPTDPADAGSTEPAEPADPFGAETAEPADPFGAESPAMVEPAAVPEDVEPGKVLGALGGLLENAFGGGGSEEEFGFGGMGDDPFGEDPFGEDGELTEEMEGPMIDEGADPFGVEEDAPSMEDVAPPDADPFGEAPTTDPSDDEPAPAPAAEPAADPFSDPFGE